MTEKELIGHMADLIDAQAAEHWPRSPWKADDPDNLAAMEVFREKAALVRACQSLAQVKVVAEHQIPIEHDGMPDSDHSFLPQEALIECADLLRQCLQQIEERDMLADNFRWEPGTEQDRSQSETRPR